MPRIKEAAADVSVDIRDATGKAAGTATLAGAVFGIKPNAAVMHQVVTAQLAAARSGTHSTKTRAEVQGGGAKPYRQKGTGRARQGSIRAPHWRGGGIAHGPKPRDYSQRTPKKMVKLAIRSALSDRAAEGKVIVINEWSFETPKTKLAREALDALGVTAAERALIVLSRDDDVAWKSFRNLGGDRRIHVIEPEQINAYDVLVSDWVVFTQATLDAATDRLSGASSAPGSPGSDGSADTTTDDEAVGGGE